MTDDPREQSSFLDGRSLVSPQPELGDQRRALGQQGLEVGFDGVELPERIVQVDEGREVSLLTSPQFILQPMMSSCAVKQGPTRLRSAAAGSSPRGMCSRNDTEISSWT